MTTIDGSVSRDWHDEVVNSALVDSIKDVLDSSKVNLVEVDAHINDPKFAEIAVNQHGGGAGFAAVAAKAHAVVAGRAKSGQQYVGGQGVHFLDYAVDTQ